MRLLGPALALLLALSCLPDAVAQQGPAPADVDPAAPTVLVTPLALAAPHALPASLPAARIQDPSSAPAGLRRFGHWALGDIRAVGDELTPSRLVVGSVLVGALSLAASQDEGVGHEAPELRTDLSRPFFAVADELGHARMQWISGGLFLATLATDDTRLQDAAFTSFEAGIYAMAASSVAKGLFGRARPYESENPAAFAPFSGHRSFPSGHTTLAFALTTPWAVYYPGPLTYGLVGLSAATAVSRLTLKEHWFSDVFAGAALGSITGYWLATRHLRQSTALHITPTLGPEGGTVTLTYSF